MAVDRLLTVMNGIDVVFVGVHCSASDLTQRESLRGNRAVGTAVNQADKVHSHGLYDLEVNTSIASAQTCSGQIRDYLQHSEASAIRAFDHLRRLLAPDGTESD